eukprot:scaffold2460_cov109-Isochrysis_galbana.AAC.4
MARVEARVRICHVPRKIWHCVPRRNELAGPAWYSVESRLIVDNRLSGCGCSQIDRQTGHGRDTRRQQHGSPWRPATAEPAAAGYIDQLRPSVKPGPGRNFWQSSTPAQPSAALPSGLANRPVGRARPTGRP